MVSQVIDVSHTQLIWVSVPMYIADVSIIRSGRNLRIEPVILLCWLSVFCWVTIRYFCWLSKFFWHCTFYWLNQLILLTNIFLMNQLIFPEIANFCFCWVITRHFADSASFCWPHRIFADRISSFSLTHQILLTRHLFGESSPGSVLTQQVLLTQHILLSQQTRQLIWVSVPMVGVNADDAVPATISRCVTTHLLSVPTGCFCGVSCRYAWPMAAAVVATCLG